MLKFINIAKFNKCSSGDIPAKIIKIAKEEVIVAITNCINKCVSSSNFSDFRFSDFLKSFGFRNGYFSKIAFLNSLKNWQKCLDALE